MPPSPFNNAALQALSVSTGFSPSLVQSALDNAFSALDPKLLNSLPSAPHPSRVLIVCPGNVFTAWLPPAVIALSMGHEVWLKPSSHEPIFPQIWKSSLSPNLSSRVRIVEWNSEIVEQCDGIVVYGSDQTIERLHKECEGKVFIGFGHQISVGVVFQEALEANTFEQTVSSARAAIEPFRLQGCLSPQTLYVEGSYDSLRKGLLGVSPLPVFHRFKTNEQLIHQLNAIPDPLACLGWIGSEASIKKMTESLSGRPTLRVCPLGEMQRPPLSWHNGGIDLVKEFARMKPIFGPVAQSVRASGS